MKQHITKDQFNQLTPKQLDYLTVNFWTDDRVDRTNQDLEPEDFTIGTMIELLASNNKLDLFNYKDMVSLNDASSLCDLLWEEVYEVTNH